MPYPKAETWEFTLEEIGAPELVVTCIDPRSVPVSEQRRIQQAQIILARYQSRGEVPRQEEEWSLEAMDSLLHKVVREWNLPYPDEHPLAGQVIPLHKPEQEPDPFGALPGEVFGLVVKEVSQRLLAPPKRPN